jgi:hypothetical protein
MPDLEEAWVAAQDPRRSGKFLRKYAAFTLLVIDEWLLDRPTESMRTIAAGTDGTPLQGNINSALHPVLAKGLAPAARLRRSRRDHGPDPPQHDLGQDRQLQHARAHNTRNRLATVTEGVSGARPRDRWRSLARTPALNRTNKWRSKLQILMMHAYSLELPLKAFHYLVGNVASSQVSLTIRFTPAVDTTRRYVPTTPLPQCGTDEVGTPDGD